MNPPFIFLFSLLFCSLLALASSDEAAIEGDEHPPMICFPTNCGNITNITYPFWVENQQPSYCGYPAFKLTCMDQILMLAMSSDKYQVKKIFYDNQSVVLANDKFINSTCPVQYSNTSFSLTPFNISSVNKQLTFVFGCSGPLPNYSVISCARPTSYLTLDPLGDHMVLPSSCEMATMPVWDYWGAGVGDYVELLENGFLVNWTAADCGQCLQTKGQCGYNNVTDNFMCICPDRAHWRYCIASITPSSAPTNASRTIIQTSHSSRGKIIGIVGAFVGFLLVSLSMALYLCRHPHKTITFCEKNLSDSQNIEDFLEEYGSVAPKRYTYSQVKRITKAFKEKLGQGGYGTVFKGTLSDGHVVAVKKLNDSRGNGEEFLNEVASIGRTSHVNIVSLRGFCSEGRKRALIYDFMCNGSLEKLLYTDKPKAILDWEKVYQIAIGIARGLEFLHRGCNTRIVHFDIKPHNILLDQDFCPKISDFGLTKLCLLKDSIISIAGARGTIGYIAPEVFSRNFGVVSSKSDVYSYGMMVLEMAEGRKKPGTLVDNSSEMYFPHWIYEHLNQNRDLLTCGVNAESEETIRKMILVGLWCIQTLPQNRPSMSRVIEMLEGSVNDLQVPPKPYLSSSPLGSLLGSSSIQDICSFDDCS